MATVVPTAAQVRKQAFGRPKIVEALQLLGVDAHHKMGAKALKAQLLQLLEGGPAGDGGGGGGDGMRVDSAGAPLAPAAGAGNPRARRGHLGGERVGGTYAGRPRGIHAQRHHLLRALDARPARAFAARRDGQPEADRRAGGHGAT